jgi:tetraprenyl-beta-curcumene synthase
VRELTWGLPAVSREVRRWRALAEAIPDDHIRQDALNALNKKRGQADGAALFSILPRERNLGFLRFLVVYQIMWDFLDSAHERAPDLANGRQLHLALIDAVDPSRPIRDYYRHHPWHDDGGYLRTLVERCRDCCATLPSYERVRALIVDEATRAQVLAINHDPDPRKRDAGLRDWARAEFANEREVVPASSASGSGATEHAACWFELTGAASAGLATFALLALACEQECGEEEIEQARDAYFPWASAVACMLDSYADQAEDAANSDHSYVAHYTTPVVAKQRMCLLVSRYIREVGALRKAETHIVIAASMAALYLSKNSARAADMQHTSRDIAAAGGSLTRALIPVLRLWRIAYGQRTT